MRITKKLAVLLLSFMTMVNMSVFAQMPDGSVIIGNKAYDLNYVNNPEHNDEIIEEVCKGNYKDIYIKGHDTNWYSNSTGKIVAIEDIPGVTYKNGEGKLTDFEAKDGEEIHLKVASAVFTDSNVVEIKFNKAVDKKSAEEKFNYKVGRNALNDKDSVLLKDDGKTVVVTLNSDIKKHNFDSSIYVSSDVADINNNKMDCDFSKNILVINNADDKVTAEKQIKKDINIIADNAKLEDLKVAGNIFISGDKTSLQNSKITGIVVVDPGKEGITNLAVVTANHIKVLSGGENSIHLKDVHAETLDIKSDSKVRVESKGKTKIENTTVYTYAIIDSASGNFGEIRVTIAEDKKGNKNQNVELRGRFTEPVVVESGVTLKAAKNAVVPKVEIAPENENSEVRLEGTFREVEVKKEAKINIPRETKITKKLKVTAQAQINADTKALVAKVEIAPNNKNAEIKLSGNFKEVVVNKEAKVDLVKGEVIKVVTNANASLNISKDSKVKQLDKKGHKVATEGEGKKNIFKTKEKDIPDKKDTPDRKDRENRPAKKTVNVAASNLTVTEGEEVSPKVTATEGAELSYTSNNENVAKFNPAAGKITGISAGTAVITVTASKNGWKSSSTTFTIIVEKAEVEESFRVEMEYSFPGAFTYDFKVVGKGDKKLTGFQLIYDGVVIAEDTGGNGVVKPLYIFFGSDSDKSKLKVMKDGQEIRVKGLN